MLKGLILELSASNMKSEFTKGFPFPRFYMKHSATSPPPPPPCPYPANSQLYVINSEAIKRSSCCMEPEFSAAVQPTASGKNSILLCPEDGIVLTLHPECIS